MTFTTVPTFIFTFLVFCLISLNIDTSAIGDMSSILTLSDTISNDFYISPILFLVPVLVIILAFLKVRPVIALSCGVVLAIVFTLIFQANENGLAIYKEEIAKKLPEYSYKTIATIVDEGVEKGYYVPLEPYTNNAVKDKKIKNIRPSEEIVTAFLNWNIRRITTVSKMIKKYSK